MPRPLDRERLPLMTQWTSVLSIRGNGSQCKFGIREPLENDFNDAIAVEIELYKTDYVFDLLGLVAYT